MYISHKHKFAFVAIPKTASTSVKSGLKSQLTLDVLGYSGAKKSEKAKDKIKKLNLKNDKLLYKDHVTAFDMKSFFNLNGWDWDEYFTFAGYRNPWAMVLSFYFYCRKTNGHKHQKKFQELTFEDTIKEGMFLHSFLFKKNKDSNNSSRCGGISKTVFQGGWVVNKNNRIIVDHIYKMENMDKEWRFICDKIGIQYEKLPHRKKTEHGDYWLYYNAEARDIIANAYKEEIEYFGYKFGED